MHLTLRLAPFWEPFWLPKSLQNGGQHASFEKVDFRNPSATKPGQEENGKRDAVRINPRDAIRKASKN